jgi:protein ImuA
MSTAPPQPAKIALAHLGLPMRRLHPIQPLLGEMGLMRARVHEICGPARVSLAAFLLQKTSGTVIWVIPGWRPERVYPPGLLHYCDPNRIIFARIRRPEDALWAMEEALRSGAAPLVLADLTDPPALTPIRRLHLAAEAGIEAAHRFARPAPLGVLLTPGLGGAQGVESRWHMAPLASGMTAFEYRAAWVLTRLRARSDPPARWQVQRANGQITLDPRPYDP